MWKCRKVDADLCKCFGPVLRFVVSAEKPRCAFPRSGWLYRFCSPIHLCQWPWRYYGPCQCCTGMHSHILQSLTCSEINYWLLQHTIVKLYQISVATLTDPSLLPEAQRIQGIAARGDFTIAKAGIAGTKALLQKLYGYGGVPRKPLPPLEEDAFVALWNHPHTQELVALEKELSGKSS